MGTVLAFARAFLSRQVIENGQLVAYHLNVREAQILRLLRLLLTGRPRGPSPTEVKRGVSPHEVRRRFDDEWVSKKAPRET